MMKLPLSLFVSVLLFESALSDSWKDCTKGKCTQSTYSNVTGAKFCACYTSPSQHLCCNYANQAVSVTEHDLRPYATVLLSNSSRLSLEVDCYSRDALQLTVSDVGQAAITNVNSLSSGCAHNLKAIASSLENIYYFKSIKCERSKVEKIGSSPFMKNLIVTKYSEVNQISDIHLSNPRGTVNECFAIEDSSIQNIENVNVTCATYMKMANVDSIASSTFHRLDLFSSKFNKVSSSGMVFQKGRHKMENVFFKSLSKHALVFEKGAEVHMRNIVVETCNAPCMVMERSMLLVNLLNFVIEGHPILPRMSKYIKLIDSSDTQFLYMNETYCRSFGVFEGHLCDFQTVGEPSSFVKEHDRDKKLIIQNHHNLSFNTDCYGSLALNNVTGYFHPYHNHAEDCQHSNVLNLVSCKLHTLYAKDVTELTAISSYFGSVHVYKLKEIKFEDVFLYSVDGLEFESNHGSIDFSWDSVTASRISNVHLKSPAMWNKVFVNSRLENIIIDHSDGETTLITSSTFKRIPKEGIIVKSGTLVLAHVAITNLEERGIVVGRRGRLVLRDTLPGMISCGSGGGIEVARRAQVVYQGAITPPWLWDCIRVRTESFETTPGYHLLTATDRDCQELWEHVGFCNMTGVEYSVELGKHNFLDHYKQVEVRGAKNLLVSDHCFEQIFLHSVSESTFQPVNNSCFFNLKMTKSKVNEIRNNVRTLYIDDKSEVTTLSPSSILNYCSVKDSEIKHLSARVEEGSFSKVSISDITSLVIKRKMTLDSIHVDHVAGVVVRKGAQLTIANSNIVILDRNAFTVRGLLILDNVRVTFAEHKSFLLNGGKLEVKNVEVYTNNGDLFHCDRANVKIENFIIAGQEILELTSKERTKINESSPLMEKLFPDTYWRSPTKSVVGVFWHWLPSYYNGLIILAFFFVFAVVIWQLCNVFIDNSVRLSVHDATISEGSSSATTRNSSDHQNERTGASWMCTKFNYLHRYYSSRKNR